MRERECGTSRVLLKKWMVRADLTNINLRPSFGKRKKEARPNRNAGEYAMNMPVLPETLNVDFRDPTFQNLEYCNCFPLISAIPLLPKNANVITDIIVTTGVGGYINPCDIELAMLDLSLSLSLKISCVCGLCLNGLQKFA